MSRLNMGWVNYIGAVRSRIRLDRGFARALWIVPFLWVRGWMRRPGQTGTIAYTPQPAGPWYTLPLALAGTGIRRVRRDADAVMVFDDRTDSAPVSVTADCVLNADIHDISKARVGRVFAEVFGYNLAVDPLTHTGPMVEKSDINGVHDGREVQGPLPAARSGCAYQKLIDTTTRPGVTQELRLTCIGGEVIVAVRKEKATEARFAGHYLYTEWVTTEDWLSEEERETLREFLAQMGLDFGSIDALRDSDGRLYVVDVNKTCMPVLALPWRELEASLIAIGEAAEGYILTAKSHANFQAKA